MHSCLKIIQLSLSFNFHSLLGQGTLFISMVKTKWVRCFTSHHGLGVVWTEQLGFAGLAAFLRRLNCAYDGTLTVWMDLSCSFPAFLAPLSQLGWLETGSF
jgi:hypothetical protein